MYSLHISLPGDPKIQQEKEFFTWISILLNLDTF
jgi:hypothetical protein